MSPYAMTLPGGIESTRSRTRCANGGTSTSRINRSDRLGRHVRTEYRSQPQRESRRIGHLQDDPAELGLAVAFDAQQQLGSPHVPEAPVVAEAERPGVEHSGHRDAGKLEAEAGQPVAMLYGDATDVIDRDSEQSPERDEHVEPAHADDEIATDDVDIEGGHRLLHLPILDLRTAALHPARPK
jgi:hypothetical protein